MSRRRRTNVIGTIALCVLFVAFLFKGVFLPEGAGSSGVKNADYCILTLMPSLAVELDLDLASRIRLATKGVALLRGLGGDEPLAPGAPPADGVSDEVGAELLERSGGEIRAILPTSFRREFEALFSDGELVRVQFWTRKESAGAEDGDRQFVSFGWRRPGDESVQRRPVRALVAELRACDRWIPSAEAAERLLASDYEDVREAAARWFARDDQKREAQRQSGGAEQRRDR